MNRALALALLLAATLLSGCVESTPGASDADAGSGSASEDAQTIRSLNATVGEAPAPAGNATDDDAAENATSWWALDLDAAVTGFRWTVPEDAARTYTWGPYSWEVIPLLATLVADDVSSYGIFVYELDGDEARLVSSRMAAPMQADAYALLPTATSFSWEVEPYPLVIYLDDDYAGEELGFVVATDGLAPDAGFSWTIMDEVPDTWDDVPETPEDYLDDRSGSLGTVAATGTGSAFRFSERAEVYYGIAGSPGVFGAAFGTDDVTVEERLPTWVPPYGGVRDATLSLEHDLDGWSVSYGYAAADSAVGTFALEVDLHGTTGSVEAAVVDVPYVASGVDALLTGLPYLYAVGEGQGGTSASIDVQVATDDENYVTVLYAASFDATLSELLGAPAVAGVYTVEGLVPLMEGAPLGAHQPATPTLRTD